MREPPAAHAAAARQSMQHAMQRAGKVEPTHGCGSWRTVQCCACSWSALHQLLHCSMALSCGFAALQLTVADLGEAAELRAWVPTSITSPQAARNVKVGGWNGGRRRLSLRHFGLAASQWHAACAARAAITQRARATPGTFRSFFYIFAPALGDTPVTALLTFKT